MQLVQLDLALQLPNEATWDPGCPHRVYTLISSDPIYPSMARQIGKVHSLAWKLLGLAWKLSAWKLPSMEFSEVLVGPKWPKIGHMQPGLAKGPDNAVRTPTCRSHPAWWPSSSREYLVPRCSSPIKRMLGVQFFHDFHVLPLGCYPHHHVHSQCRSVNV